ncbi:MAG: phosphoribosylformylglycinamidine cyclo-ligase [Candidatus Omnitrophota bacterium]|nr:phosphoribosylformylglycinamidine cyclo-ligase [Candidatus Omnitrophota bacterium]
MNKLTYKSTGVNIAKANIFLKRIKPLIKKTLSKQASQIGGFGALFKFDKDKFKQPILVSSTDGVGTKLKIAQELNKHDTVGIDLVAMNVNDILCCGAKPLFFLDYIACGKLNTNVLTNVVSGIAKGCVDAGCSLIGGETAQMPGMYEKDEYDLAGFVVGVVEKSKLIDGSKIRNGDCLIGIESSGLHSNGFSLVRKVFSKIEIKKYAKELLKPTRIYVKPIINLFQTTNHEPRTTIKGIAHITGGAYYEKIPRIIPKGLSIKIYKGSWQIPKIFKIIQKKGNIDEQEMFRTFNMGLGMVLIVDTKDANFIKNKLSSFGLKSWVIGKVIKGNKKVEIL